MTTIIALSILAFIVISLAGGYIIHRKVKDRSNSYLYKMCMSLIPGLVSGLLLLLLNLLIDRVIPASEAAMPDEPICVTIDQFNITFTEEDGKQVFTYPFTPLDNGTYELIIESLEDTDALSVVVFDQEGNSLNFSTAREEAKFYITIDDLAAYETYSVQLFLN